MKRVRSQVGHSLENDLIAMRIVHMRVLDTAIMFPHPKGPPHRSALRILASKFLQRTIQTGQHDSVSGAAHFAWLCANPWLLLKPFVRSR